MSEHTIEPLFDEAAVAARVRELADEVADILPPEFTLLALLKGSFVFAADLARELSRRGCAPRSSSCGCRATAAGRRVPASSA
jgi:hypoxanthine phosphoribosyltransferase